jgi:hypothetical protein
LQILASILTFIGCRLLLAIAVSLAVLWLVFGTVLTHGMTDRVVGSFEARGVPPADAAFVAERLLLGQWALLLGYAGLPWVLRAASRLGHVRDLPRSVLALLPAAAAPPGLTSR